MKEAVGDHGNYLIMSDAQTVLGISESIMQVFMKEAFYKKVI